MLTGNPVLAVAPDTAAARSSGKVAFDRMRGGYDVQDVQTFLRWFDRKLASNEPQQWDRARTALRLTGFRTQFRVYDREQVRDRLAMLAERLGRISGERCAGCVPGG